MVMFILEIMVPHVEIEGVSTEYANVSALTFRVKKVAFSVGAFDSRLFALEATAGLEVGGGTDISRNKRRNKNRRSGANGSYGNGGGVIVDIP